MGSFNAGKVAQAVRELLGATGVDTDAPLLADTPRRVASAFHEFFSGVGVDERAPLQRGDVVPEGTELVTLRDLEFRSTCAHHLLPFSGMVHVVYEPAQRLVGIGSIVRCLSILSSRPQLQEDLTQQLAQAIMTGAGAAGSLVVIDARHSCIADRGPREAASRLVTVATAGSLRKPERRAEGFLTLNEQMDAGCHDTIETDRQ